MTMQINENLKYEAARLRTFTAWPKENIVSKTDLAQNGFYYTGVADKVKCTFCNNELAKWERGDVPREQHKQWYPDCRFLSDADVGNISLSYGNSRFSSSHLMMQLKLREDRLSNLSSMVRSDYAQLEKRKATFQGWKGPRNPTASEMALAGLYSVGKDDQVYCYACGQGLSHWNPGENPFVEHARWKHNCPHVLALKGNDFVECVVRHYQCVERGSVQPAEQLIKVLLEAELASADVKMLREAGVSNTDIQAALELQLHKSYTGFEDPLALLVAVQKLQQQQPPTAAAARPALAANPAPVGVERESLGGSQQSGSARRPTDSSTPAVPLDAEALARENAQLREVRVCKVCMENDINILLKPCHHACICSECRRHVTQCPMCRSSIKSTETVYLS